MNYRFVIRQLGWLFIVLSLSTAAVVVLTWILHWMTNASVSHNNTAAMWALLISVVIGLLIGGVLWLASRGAGEFLGRREALLLVAVTWLIGAAYAALPFFCYALIHPGLQSDHPFNHFINCYFEAMSGLTTTGATVLSDIGSLPDALKLWRATTAWLGGLGIVVLFVAVFPTVGVGGKKLYQFEATGPTHAGVRPRIRETARVLWLIYLGLTGAQIVALKLCGMSMFDSICHTFTTVATSGFAAYDASIGAPAFGAAAQIVVIVFMVLAGVNFGLYFQVFRGRARQVWTDPELRAYLGIMLIAVVVVIVFIVGRPMQETNPAGTHESLSWGGAVLHGVFQTVSLQTTTGFCTADFDQWSFAPTAVLVMLMFIGGSAGSTSGGVKVIRWLIVFKVLAAELERAFRPNVVRTVRVGRTVIDPDLRQATLAYVLGILFLTLVGAVLIMMLEQNNADLAARGQSIDFKTAGMASIATLNNIGPGLGLIGATQNYGWFGTPSKLVMCVFMALGRLEVFAIMVLFCFRTFWRSE
ncbi:MAG: TrkH family potassium uptake protein [Phycisphaeraceae bacterium]|nr:TrkH family potassium uptake protein [Phycisphaeraceae bacterium]